MDSELKPCPFCGGGAKMLSRGGLHYVVCWEKVCLINPKTTWYNTKEKAIEAWNRRAEDGKSIHSTTKKDDEKSKV